MATEKSIRRIRRGYAMLLRLYPRSFHKRFGSPMEQTFNDLLRERAEKNGSLYSFVVWIFGETLAGAVGENMTVMNLKSRAFIRVVLITGLILSLPLIAMRFTDEVVWDLTDFLVAGALLMGAGLTYEWVASKAGTTAYRVAAGIAVAASLLLVWANLAVGIIGNESNPANLMFFGIPAIGIVGAIVARFKPLGMSRTLLAMALAQILVAVIASIAGLGHTPVLTAVFVVIWLTSAWLFRRSGEGAVQ